MFKIKNRNLFKENKVYIIVISALAAGLIVAWISYALFGHKLISAIYEGRSLEVLNRIIEAQAKTPLEVYLDKGDREFFKLSMIFTSSVLSFIFLFSIWSGKAISKKWFLLLVIVLSFFQIGSHVDFNSANNLLIFDDYPKYFSYTVENARLLTEHGTPFGFNHNFQGGIPTIYLRSCFLEFIPFSLFLGEESAYLAMMIFFLILIPVSLFFLVLELTKNEDTAKLASFIAAFGPLPWRHFFYGMAPAMVAIPLLFLSILFFLRYINNKRYSLFPLIFFSSILAYTHLVIFVIGCLSFAMIFIYNIIKRKEALPDFKKLIFFCVFNFLICSPLYYSLLNYMPFLKTTWGYFEKSTFSDCIASIIFNLKYNARLNNPLFFSALFLLAFYNRVHEPNKKIIIRNATVFSLAIFILSSFKNIASIEIFIRRISVTLVPYIVIFNLSLFILPRTGRAIKLFGIFILLLFVLGQYTARYHFYIRTADTISDVDSKIDLFVSSKDYALFENCAHMYPAKCKMTSMSRIEYDRCRPSERGHWLMLLQKHLGSKFFSNTGEDAHPYNNLRHMYITNGLYKGELLGENNGEEFIALLKDWGVNKACVWSPTAKTFFDKSGYFKFMGESEEFTCYKATYDILPEVRLDRGGTGRIIDESPFSFTVSIEGISEKQAVVINKNYFNFWSAYNEQGKKISLRDYNQKICFDVSDNGYIYFKYRKNILLNLMSIIAMFLVLILDFLRHRRISNRHI